MVARSCGATRLAFVVALVAGEGGAVAQVSSARPLPADATATAAAAALAPPPAVLLERWLPLSRGGGPLPSALPASLVRALRKGQAADGCQEAVAFWDQRTREAAALFYSPTRAVGASVAVGQYLDRWLHGASPVMVIAEEFLAPAPSWRDEAVRACVRAGRMGDAERLLLGAASSPAAGRARAAMVLVRWARLGDLRPLRAWLDGGPVVPAALLMRAALAAGGQERRELLDRARSAARDSPDPGLVEAVEAWLAARP